MARVREHCCADTQEDALVQEQLLATPGRLDKVALVNLKVKDMQVHVPGFLEVPKPGNQSDSIPWSDHSGLSCTFDL